MGVWGLLATVIPLGIGAAFTPSLFAMQVLVVSGDPWRRRALAVASGNAVSFILVGTLFYLGFAHGPLSGSHASELGAVLRAAGGVILLGFAVWLFLPHPALKKRVEADIQGYAARASSWVFFGVAFALSIKDVSSFVMLIPALHDIAVAKVDVVVQLAMLVLLYVLALSPVLLPPTLRLVFGHRIDRLFQDVYRFTMDHQFAIVGVMCAIIGVFLLVTASVSFFGGSV